MKWWYEPQKDKDFHYCDDYEECLDKIVAICRFSINRHSVPNYYIYNENGLFDIIKGSEIDPLSICRINDNYSNRDVSLSERENTFEKEYLRLKKIVRRQYKRTSEQLIEIQEKIDIIEGNKLEEDYSFMNDSMIIKEFSIKYDNGNILTPYVNRIFENYIDNTKDMNEISSMMIENYDIPHLTEEYSFVIGYLNNKILGVYPMSKGTDSSCPMNIRMIFKFLLLIGANGFVVIHNHPCGDLNMSKNDIDVTRAINEAANYMDFNFIDHIIIAKNDYIGIKDKIIEKEIIFN